MTATRAGDGDRLVLLGTAGGPLPSPVRAGISQAVVVGGHAYLVDCGSGVTRQLRRAGLLRYLESVFLTHLHSDHDCDYFNLFLLGWPILARGDPIRVTGPGRAGGLPEPRLSPNAPQESPHEGRPRTVSPANPTPGLVDLTQLQLQAHAYDINLRMRNVGRRDLRELIEPLEVRLPDGASHDNVAPPLQPFKVFEDSRVRVTATLVEHGPVFPSFAFRFDTDSASVVLSGDTAPCPNLVALAAGADVLVHEVYDDTAPSPEADNDSWESRLRELHLRTAHTGLSEVGRIAAQADVRRLVLTHFIPGDDVLPVAHWLNRVRDFGGEVVVGEDLMELAL